MTDIILCTAVRPGEEVRPTSTSYNKICWRAKHCSAEASTDSGALLLCQSCYGKYNGGLGHPEKGGGGWHGHWGNIHEKSHIEGSKWYRTMIWKAQEKRKIYGCSASAVSAAAAASAAASASASDDSE